MTSDEPAGRANDLPRWRDPDGVPRMLRTDGAPPPDRPGGPRHGTGSPSGQPTAPPRPTAPPSAAPPGPGAGAGTGTGAGTTAGGWPADAPSPTTGRRRRLVTGLPAWEPLPPGEVLVTRPRNGL
ncbi:hypothetical protein [Streptomyces sp. NPDC005859]|uniref:hypothetical protein n=1 Tax=Streptomyces sp. NPDC005859 TaxID=3157170 RepID=UPI00340501BB